MSGRRYQLAGQGRVVQHLRLKLFAEKIADAADDSERDVTMFWEHEGNAAVRRGKWKLVRNFTAVTSARAGFDEPDQRGDWELYDLEADRTELSNLAAQHPDRVAEMAAQWKAWAERCGVIPRDDLLAAAKAWREKNG